MRREDVCQDGVREEVSRIEEGGIKQKQGYDGQKNLRENRNNKRAV